MSAYAQTEESTVGRPNMVHTGIEERHQDLSHNAHPLGRVDSSPLDNEEKTRKLGVRPSERQRGIWHFARSACERQPTPKRRAQHECPTTL